ncbi:YbjN domain-containing protein [Corynebacterium timonense]|uniref:Putative sensory transduction regulator n=1 Tax=Corynebacterium timonense TaxID=441500 RepID=A0A1H1MS87_9CORY|nr:YbjN domain-containing protein [Corynebacterium timonense]SDR89557.1 Putative sensory transduction regulator [Corynebacterium timonense]
MARRRHSPHRSTAGLGQHPREVTLERVADALRGLGFEPLEQPDRLVVPSSSYIATLWVSHTAPLMLVADYQERIPVDFAHSAALARYINTWNHDRLGPTASYRLTDAGDLAAHLRTAIRVKHGLSDEQLVHDICAARDDMLAFSADIRETFLPEQYRHPLPPTLARAQDIEALVGEHPSARHLPRGGEVDVDSAPDEYTPPRGAIGGHTCQEVGIAQLEKALDSLNFTYDRLDDDIVATSINAVPFGACIDDNSYARLTAMWDSGKDARMHFLPMWLMCNGINEKSAGLRAYLHVSGSDLHVHVETTCLITAGLTSDQLHTYVRTSLVSILRAVDVISRQSHGTSAVDWP